MTQINISGKREKGRLKQLIERASRNPKIREALEGKAVEDNPVEQPVEQPDESQLDLKQGKYILLPNANTYAKGVYALREACKADPNSAQPVYTLPNGDKIIRPLTFKETIEARVEDYETLTDEHGNKRTEKDRLQYFGTWIDSCTGIAYEAKTTKFKIIPVCDHLIMIDKDFNGAYLSVDYHSLTGTELDRSKQIYRVLLPKNKVLAHPGWRAALEEDVDLLRTYCNIVFAELNDPEKAMGFYLRNNVATGELLSLFVNYLYYYSYAYGLNYLYGVGHFLRVAHPK